MLNERKLTDREVATREDAIKDLKPAKRGFVKRYGRDAEAIMYATATKRAKKKVEEMNKESLKELIKDALTNKVNEKVLVGDQHELPDFIKDKIKAATEAALSKKPQVEEKEMAKEDLNEGTDLYDRNGIQITRYSGGERGLMTQISYGGKYIQIPVTEYSDLVRAMQSVQGDLKDMTRQLPKVKLKDLSEDLDVGHEDDEPRMIKKELYRIAKYATELYRMVGDYDEMGSEVDFPSWLQAKITKAHDMMVSSKHYLDGEEKIDQIDAMLDSEPEMDDIDTPSDVVGMEPEPEMSDDSIEDRIKNMVGEVLKETNSDYSKRENKILNHIFKNFDSDVYEEVKSEMDAGEVSDEKLETILVGKHDMTQEDFNNLTK